MMELPISVDAFSGLVCPACGSALAATDSSAACTGCDRSFPSFGGVPCLMRDAAHYRVDWLGKLEDYVEVTRDRIREWTWEAEQGGLLTLTRERLIRLIAAKEREVEVVKMLFEPVRVGSTREVAYAVARAQDGPNRLAVLASYENVFRDWGWGGAESVKLVELIRPHAPGGAKRVAILGAGAGRFAVEAQRALAAHTVFALDINPLPLLIAQRLTRGERLDLFEFPASPIGARQSVVATELACLEPPGNGLRWVLGDALFPPFAPASLDLVIAPWFVDVCGVDLRTTLAIVNRTLAPGSTFIQLGPLDFDTRLSRAYSFEECLELYERAGFEVRAAERTALPYFDSPHSGSHRVDSVYLIAAQKRAAGPLVRIASSDPAWIDDPTLPVPATPALTALGQRSMLTAMVVRQLDGTRSIAEIAEVLAASAGVDAGEMREELRVLLRKQSLA